MNTDNEFTPRQQFLIWTAVTLVACILGLLAFRVIMVTKVEVHELGFAFDKFSGKIEVFKDNGWVVRNPIQYDVHTIDLRPRQVQIAANSRVLNAKLVRFDPKGLTTFIEWHGRDGADGSVSVGHEKSEPKLYEVLKSYAFNVNNGTDCPFLIIENELAKHSERPGLVSR